jgi:23S rRNA maturation-related 3'-5' exoribonuclease YhaM
MLENMLKTGKISQRFYDWLIANGFTTAPASTKYHGAFEGGLYEH